MYSLYEYIFENFEDIINIVLSYINKGGIKPGVYEYVDYMWEIKKEA
jgi:hypothetical protein